MRARRGVVLLGILTAAGLLRGAESVEAAEPGKVIVVSFDGAGFAMVSRLLAMGKLPHFQRLVAEGAWSDGMVTSFPTKTAAAHALLFTGRYGRTSGITGNELLKLPKESGSRLETLSGYFSTGLRVDPLWAMAAEEGLDVYVLHAPQLYPFRPLPHLFAATGYTDVRSEAFVLTPAQASLGPPGPDFDVPEARGREAREIRFRVGESSFRGLFFDDPIDPTEGCDTMGIAPEDSLSGFVARVKPGEDERFSVPIAAKLSGEDVWFSLRLFSLSPDAASFLLYGSGTGKVLASTPDFPGRGLPRLEAFSATGGGAAYTAGELGTTLVHGGTGEAERRFVETEAQLASEFGAQAGLVLARDYRLVVLYSSVSDEVAHELGGYLDPGLRGYDPGLAEKLWPVVAEGFALQDRILGEVFHSADREGAHVVVVSDHGMAATNKRVFLNVALEHAGLLALDPKRAIDLARTRALAPPLSDASVAVNTVDRPGGIVPLEEREAVLREVRHALEALVDPATGERIVTGVFEPATSGLLQPGGDSTGDLFLDFAPGYYPSTSTREDAIAAPSEPSGEHIFVPTRREMLAIFGMYGPRIPTGVHLGRVRAVDVTPTLLDLLGMAPRTELPGTSLVPAQGILN